MAKNSDYFTFYVNNSNTEDLSQQLKNVKQQGEEQASILTEQSKAVTARLEAVQKEFTTFEGVLSNMTAKNEQM